LQADKKLAFSKYFLSKKYNHIMINVKLLAYSGSVYYRQKQFISFG